ncbi:hypothetical protein HZB96_02195 [Candidatus Gottesmanbacteria bacterium]|nr:hypothetical protein [Candidatus Gottesmanbacteria bacterium]
MRLLLFFLFLFIIIFESTLFPVPLTLLCVMTVSILWEEEVEIWAFAGGLILDLFIPRLLGIDSIFFLTVVFLSRRYHNKIHSEQFIFYTIFFLLILAVYSLIFYKNLSPVQLVVFIALSAGFLFFTKQFFPAKSPKKRLSI